MLGEGGVESSVGRTAELGVVLALALLERGLHHDDGEGRGEERVGLRGFASAFTTSEGRKVTN